MGRTNRGSSSPRPCSTALFDSRPFARDGPSAPSALSRLHVVVPHCTLRHVLTFAMRDFGVRPIRDRWRPVLDDAHDVLEASMEWAHHESFSLSD